MKNPQLTSQLQNGRVDAFPQQLETRKSYVCSQHIQLTLLEGTGTAVKSEKYTFLQANDLEIKVELYS